ncbi:hypothetical protein O3G_MSEX006038 [Manduca sexta]|uniref:RNA-directed DNA polymerase n=1 Tax=Manduca sexta TaxID=7130 RepID=A0A921Z220_MANSE|nr:hypothetical protein O3G_MSEX006038 [Manduca sexta]
MVTMNSVDSGDFTIASHAGAGKLPVISSAPLGVGELPTITSRPFRVNDVPAIVPGMCTSFTSNFSGTPEADSTCVQVTSVHALPSMSPPSLDRVTMSHPRVDSLSAVDSFKSDYPQNSENHSHRRPILGIEILDTRGMALLDTGAKGCVAGSSLYSLLKKKNYPCKEVTRRIRLADGSAQMRQVLVTNLEVKIKQNQPILTEFIIFPNTLCSETLLGIDFINAAGLVIDFATSTWKFSGDVLSYPLEYEASKSCTTVSTADILRADEGIMLSPEQRLQLSDLLLQNQDIFQAGGAPTPYAEHHIDTGDHPPISVPPYRLTPAKKELMKTELDKMLNDGIIEECESAWTSPAVLVPKKNGGVRFCIDYRRLNAITKTDCYPIPLIDELLQMTKRDCFMSTIDLKAGYWQVNVAPEDQDKTAFVTPFGTYRFKRMPFGLKNAPSTFQRLIDRFRSGASLQNVTLLAYLDDLMIITQGSFEQHLRDLQKVFDRLRHFGLCANREKCFFARQEVSYLGHIITPQGIRPDLSKIDAIQQRSPPNNIKQLKSFLQTCSWFRKFIHDFAMVAEPLTKLTRKNEPWRWDEAQQLAFDALKCKLCEAPILIQADYSQPFLLRTDASNYAIGASLLQGDGNDERPIEYASRLLTSAERNYTTTEREALAVVWAVDKFRGYIDGHTCIVKSDHQPLRWLLTLKTPSGRLIRWALKLQSYDLRIEYAPGKVNVLADTLSRPVCEDVSTSVYSVTLDLPHVSAADLRTAQLEDPDVLKIIRDLEADDELASNRWLERGYMMSQGILYRYDPDGDSEEIQLVVPVSKREEILKEFHDSPTAGHQGVTRTLNRLRERYFFPGMRRFVAGYLKNCIDCQRYKATNQKPSGLLQTPVLQQRSEVLAVDLFGPLPSGHLGERWILLVEDVATRWVELFALKDATAENCSQVLIEEYFLRYGLPRRVISDNGPQFISAVMQQCMFVFGIKQELIPVYHPEANPAERKNRDLKVQLAMLVKTEHHNWPKHLAQVRFALNSAVCCTTGKTPAYLTFAREMRTPFDVRHDLRTIMDKENFVPQATPYLRSFIGSLCEIRERVERRQDQRKVVADADRRPAPKYSVGDLVLIATHRLGIKGKGTSSKFLPKRDGPYVVSKLVSPTTFVLADLNNTVIGKYQFRYGPI